MFRQLPASLTAFPKIPATRRRLLLALPATGFIALAGVLALGLNRDPSKTWTVAGKAPAELIAIAASIAKSERLYGAAKSGLKVSDDGGSTWRPFGSN